METGNAVCAGAQREQSVILLGLEATFHAARS
jgi:hypothetical protein